MPHVKCVTYNGLKFDLPFIWKRALMLNVRNEPSINFFQFRRRVVDIYLERNFGLYMSDLPTFDPDCSLTGRSFAEGVVSERRAEACEGRQYGEYVMSKDPDKVQMAHNHLIADLEETMELYQKDPSLRL